MAQVLVVQCCSMEKRVVRLYYNLRSVWTNPAALKSKILIEMMAEPTQRIFCTEWWNWGKIKRRKLNSQSCRKPTHFAYIFLEKSEFRQFPENFCDCSSILNKIQIKFGQFWPTVSFNLMNSFCCVMRFQVLNKINLFPYKVLLLNSRKCALL